MWRSLNIKLLGKQANLLLRMAMNPVRIYQDLLLGDFWKRRSPLD